MNEQGGEWFYPLKIALARALPYNELLLSGLAHQLISLRTLLSKWRGSPSRVVKSFGKR
jgi:hypothetical protein